ncbi:hypothetical protein [Sphingopyxis sp.]|uniref:hypothetical protein n=1 Tax=Sphingopyxis sp. TaxID=1908224 RepID=UPI003D097888
MLAFLARLVLTISLLFGSVVAPAMAGAEAGHAMEIVDAGCDVLATAADADGQSPDNAPPLHIDHHHCSACTELNGRSPAADMLVSKGLFFGRSATVLASYAAAPPTQPPSA